MLYKYIDTERNVKQSDGLNVTYFVSGLTKPDDSGEQVITFLMSFDKETLLHNHINDRQYFFHYTAVAVCFP